MRMIRMPLKDQNCHSPTYENDQNAPERPKLSFSTYDNYQNALERPKL
jgi:hypothetical protein